MPERQFPGSQSPPKFRAIVIATRAEPRAGPERGLRADHRARVDSRALPEARDRLDGAPSPAPFPPPTGVSGKLTKGADARQPDGACATGNDGHLAAILLQARDSEGRKSLPIYTPHPGPDCRRIDACRFSFVTTMSTRLSRR
jgi:hypothetical protein